ncbi:MAG: sensor histidine kinase [Proteobacteria bacterium]|nr:sensor histidine kinase [Pseudomonadota bacterium]
MKISIKNRSLSIDLCLFAFCLILLISIILAFLTFKEQSNRVLGDLEEKALRIQSTLTDDIDYVSYQMEFLGNQITSGNPEDLNFIYKTLSYSKTNHKVNISTTWNMFSWVNKDFQLVADGEAGIMEAPKDLSIRDYIPHTVDVPWKFHLGEPVHGAVSRQWIIPGGMGYTNKNGEYIGAVVFGFEIGSLVTKLENTIKADGISFAILDKNLNVIAESRSNKLIKNGSTILDNLKNNTESGKYGTISKQSLFEDGSSYSYFYQVDKYPFTIVTSYDPTLVKSELIDKVFSKLVEFSLLSLLILALIWLLRKVIVKPITDLSNVANDIAFSSNMRNVKLPRSNSYEINSLLQSLLNVRKLVRKERRTSNENKEYLKIIKEYDKEKEEFLRDMYHMLNTPLNAVINGADIARTKMLGNDIDNYTEYFEAMYDAGIQLKSFTTEFINPELIDIEEIISKCVKIQLKFASEKRSQLSYQTVGEIPEIWADKTRLKQIILSTLYHSLFYVPSGKRCTITTSVECLSGGEPACLIIKIEDNGWGYDEKMRADDWEIRFGKEETSSFSRNPDMMKLSISTIRHMVKLHHGSFDMQAKSGSGSVFTIRLPYLPKEDLIIHPDDYAKPAIKKTIKRESNVVLFPR